MSAASAPSAEAQVDFLLKLQRVLLEGSFVATYKFALLHALADLALIHGDDSDASLELTTSTIAARVAELYWRQVAPHPAGAHVHQLLLPGGELESVLQLRQFTGPKPAAILRHVSERAGAGRMPFGRVQATGRSWSSIVREVDDVVRRMPLWKLQTVGTEQVEFLYANDPAKSARRITLKPGVSYCLRAYHGLVTELVRGAWVRFVRRQNPALDAGTGDLARFLFGSDRERLDACAPHLHVIQAGRCFYCDGTLRGAAEVDHFIPWSRYPANLAHNLVLAHGECNGRKSDWLPSEVHLLRWADRNRRLGEELGARLAGVGVRSDLSGVIGVARWAYAQTERLQGQVWSTGPQLQPLTGSWREILAA